MPPDVDDWLIDFLERHRMRWLPFDWPEMQSDEAILFIGVWSRAFRANNVTEAEADEASESLYETPPKYRPEHLPAILRAVREARAKRSAAIRLYEPTHYPMPESERFKWPEHIKRGDIIGLCEYLTGQGRAAK